MIRSAYFFQLVLVLAISTGCKSSPGVVKSDRAELVHVAVVEFTNLSSDSAQDYLRASISDATTQSMDRIFEYYRVPSTSTPALASDLKAHNGNLPASELRGHGLEIDADLIIYGAFSVTKGKKGDQVEITMRVFRTDKSVVIATLTQQAQVSNRLFDEIDKLAAGLVGKIVEYRKQLLTESGRQDKPAVSDAKIELTRDSINISPFIPPVF